MKEEGLYMRMKRKGEEEERGKDKKRKGRI